jgi:3-oxoacyl-[acyl-carrier-protein] synthase II
MKIYINGSSSISAWQSLNPPVSFHEPFMRSEDRLSCIEPDYEKILEPSQIRRLSRILKMGMAVSREAIKNANNPEIDAIIAGTGYGYLEDTARFLFKMTNPEDRGMNPTSFIQATSNTISSLIALNLKCNGYNSTFVHSGTSFESAVDDAILLLNEGEAKNILVGGADELTDEVYFFLKRLLTARMRTRRKELFQQPEADFRFGEGCSFFVLSDQPAHDNPVEISHFKLLYKPGKGEVSRYFSEITANQKIDLFLLGKNSEKSNDESYAWVTPLIAGQKCYNYKSLCGDYPTAPSFGLWLATSALSGTGISGISSEGTNSVLIYNCFEKNYHSFFLLKKG